MICLGIDPSLTGTGLVVLDENYQIRLTQTLKNKLFGVDRLIWIRDEVDGIIKKFLPALVVIEGYAMGIRGTHVFGLGELGGILRVLVYENEVSYIDVSPPTLKKFVCEKGNAQKNIMLEQTFKKFGVGSETLSDDNQVDAYGLARLGVEYQKYSLAHPVSKELKTLLDKLERIIP